MSRAPAVSGTAGTGSGRADTPGARTPYGDVLTLHLEDTSFPVSTALAEHLLVHIIEQPPRLAQARPQGWQISLGIHVLSGRSLVRETCLFPEGSVDAKSGCAVPAAKQAHGPQSASAPEKNYYFLTNF